MQYKAAAAPATVCVKTDPKQLSLPLEASPFHCPYGPERQCFLVTGPTGREDGEETAREPGDLPEGRKSSFFGGRKRRLLLLVKGLKELLFQL